jgi:hypothetical protein
MAGAAEGGAAPCAECDGDAAGIRHDRDGDIPKARTKRWPAMEAKAPGRNAAAPIAPYPRNGLSI